MTSILDSEVDFDLQHDHPILDLDLAVKLPTDYPLYYCRVYVKICRLSSVMMKNSIVLSDPYVYK